MASSSVQYYEKQRALQNSITNCEQERIDLERQLHVALKADQTTAKMKATRLHTYWRKICEDERRAKQRNAMLMKEFDRIDAHMSELNSRTQRLAIMKKHYEEYISRTYPKWNELMQGAQQQAELLTHQPQGTTSSEYSKHPQEAAGIFNRGSTSIAEVSVGKKTDKRTETSGLTHYRKNEKDHETQHHHQRQKQQNSQETILYTQQVVSRQKVETVSGIYANLPNSQSDNQKLHQTGASDHASARHHTLQETVSDKKVTNQSTGSGKTAQVTKAMQPEELDDDEENSDFGSGSDLPMGQSLGNTQIRVDIQPTADKTGSLLKIDGLMKPELSIDGLMNLLQHVEFDMLDAFSCEDFYRSSLPDTANKNDVIRKANSAGDLSKVDTSMITMVVLEQIRNIVRNLTEKCLLPENLLQNVSSLTVAILRQHLSPEAQVIWDALYAHFRKLIQCDVMKPPELAAVFTPCLVTDGGSLDKAQKFIIQLLEEVTDSTMGITVISKANKITSPGKKTTESFVEDEKVSVPPLKFGSLLDKPLSDDESSYINSSLLRDTVPLKETEAYKSMVSINDRGQPHRQLSGHDDTDDDVEKQIASAIVKNPITLNPPQKRVALVDDPSETSSQTIQTSPHVYVPSVMDPRQTMIASRNPPSKFQGVKISSDLDTDTEVDAGIFGSSRRPEENSDFDFYD